MSLYNLVLLSILYRPVLNVNTITWSPTLVKPVDLPTLRLITKQQTDLIQVRVVSYACMPSIAIGPL
jgi:hypothetical protein